MYNTSLNYKKQIRSNSREWDIYIVVTLANGSSFRLEKDDISLGTTSLKEGATCSDTVQVGSTYSNSFEFTILNKDGKYTDYDFYKARVEPYVGLYIPYDVNAYEYVPLGVFWVLENVKKMSTIPIIGFDSMSLTNRVFDFSSIVFPTTCATIFEEVTTQCSIVATQTLIDEVANLDYEINSLLTNDPTCRDILAGFGILLKKNLRFNRSGELESFWYQQYYYEDAEGVSQDAGSTDKNTRVGNSSYNDNLTNITGVYVEDAYGNLFSVGTEEYPVELPTSPIIQGSEATLPILEEILTQLQSIPARQSKVYYIGDPSIQSGDILVHKSTPVGDITLPVMTLLYKLAGTCTLESYGPDESTQQQSTSTEKKLKKAFAKADKDKAELKTLISQTKDNILLEVSSTYATSEQYSSLDVRIGNIQSTVSTQEAQMDSVQESVSQLQQDSESYKIKIERIVTDGVSKVRTSNNYTFDDDGLNIERSDSPVSNKLDNTGMYVKNNDTTVLEANADGVEAINISVKKYLEVGLHARFEDYTDEDGRPRTACFYVG